MTSRAPPAHSAARHSSARSPVHSAAQSPKYAGQAGNVPLALSQSLTSVQSINSPSALSLASPSAGRHTFDSPVGNLLPKSTTRAKTLYTLNADTSDPRWERHLVPSAVELPFAALYAQQDKTTNGDQAWRIDWQQYRVVENDATANENLLERHGRDDMAAGPSEQSWGSRWTIVLPVDAAKPDDASARQLWSFTFAGKDAPIADPEPRAGLKVSLTGSFTHADLYPHIYKSGTVAQETPIADLPAAFSISSLSPELFLTLNAFTMAARDAFLRRLVLFETGEDMTCLRDGNGVLLLPPDQDSTWCSCQVQLAQSHLVFSPVLETSDYSSLTARHVEQMEYLQQESGSFDMADTKSAITLAPLGLSGVFVRRYAHTHPAYEHTRSRSIKQCELASLHGLRESWHDATRGLLQPLSPDAQWIVIRSIDVPGIEGERDIVWPLAACLVKPSPAEAPKPTLPLATRSQNILSMEEHLNALAQWSGAQIDQLTKTRDRKDTPTKAGDFPASPRPAAPAPSAPASASADSPRTPAAEPSKPAKVPPPPAHVQRETDWDLIESRPSPRHQHSYELEHATDPMQGLTEDDFSFFDAPTVKVSKAHINGNKPRSPDQVDQAIQHPSVSSSVGSGGTFTSFEDATSATTAPSTVSPGSDVSNVKTPKTPYWHTEDSLRSDEMKVLSPVHEVEQPHVPLTSFEAISFDDLPIAKKRPQSAVFKTLDINVSDGRKTKRRRSSISIDLAESKARYPSRARHTRLQQSIMDESAATSEDELARDGDADDDDDGVRASNSEEDDGAPIPAQLLTAEIFSLLGDRLQQKPGKTDDAVVSSALDNPAAKEHVATSFAEHLVENPDFRWVLMRNKPVAAPVASSVLPHSIVLRATDLISRLDRGTADEVTEVTDALERLDAPPLILRRRDMVIKSSPLALPNWSKLGFTPLSGCKNVTVVALHGAQQSSASVRQWLGRTAAAYSACGLGTCEVAHALAEGGARRLPTGAMDLRKGAEVAQSLIDLRQTLRQHSQSCDHLTVMLVDSMAVPAAVMSLLSFLSEPTLEQTADKHRPHPFLVHLVAPDALLRAFEISGQPGEATDETALAFRLYDRLRLEVEHRSAKPETAEALGLTAKARHGSFQGHAFTLSLERVASRPRIDFSWPSRSLDILDRHRMLHVAYAISADRRWLCLACVDDRGEGHTVRVKLLPANVQPGQTYIQACLLVWELAQGTATSASVEWRVVIVKMGLLEALELAAWERVFASAASRWSKPAHLSLLATDAKTPLLLRDTKLEQVASADSPTDSLFGPDDEELHHGKTLIDLQSRHYACILAQPSELYNHDLRLYARSLASAFMLLVPDQPTLAQSHSWPSLVRSRASKAISSLNLYYLSSHRTATSTYTSSIEATLRDITRSYSDLHTLARARWQMHDVNGLPWHLASVSLVEDFLASQISKST
ncbi:uncharacterized protein L969DRAFT_46139 [Mixia osmundae IAM 14324]|uniref:Mediator of RNA polymerase II transcription subunit 13 n=1 Tax=Mixia osmundae (strain CBS 9802 / IAM 14324 / JCM 22182 / KY 12970) TaxID=764103 RepID=G7E5N7_MIXOS|nr:uncharacterized protein L969DRAFT_46139 [Mixia osmundae IAM 14324]KEI40704.1 hypothetical protein L969DRAFT_46139 [Mixia osmundae IAM 14324]GAA98147.1 hypothetical protein E5Q_04830 [Mixia osmundae IAM 14324]